MSPAARLTGGGSQAAGDILGHVRVEELVDLPGNWSGRRGDRMSGDFADADEISIRRSDEDFLRGVKILRAKRLLGNRHAGFGRNLEQDSAGDSFETPGIQRRR